MLFSSITLLFLAQVSLAVRIYLHPPLSPEISEALTARVSPAQARLLVSQHLGLDSFDSVEELQWDGLDALLRPASFVGEGPQRAIIVTLDESVAKDVIPPSLKSSFSLANPSSVQEQISSTLSSLLHRAKTVYSSVISTQLQATDSGSSFDERSPVENPGNEPLKGREPPRLLDIFYLSSSDATSQFLSEATELVTLVESDDMDSFGAFELTSLFELAAEFGKQSEQYKQAVELIRGLFSSVMSDTKTKIVLMTYPLPSTSTLKRRQAAAQPPDQTPFPIPTPSPQMPIGSVSTCYSSVDACNNATDTCSGRGTCSEASKAGKTCFVCACETTVDEKGRKEVWVGDACERKDISGPFVLLTGTAVVLILLVAGSLALMASIGNQELPSVLTSTVSGSRLKRD